jgi:chemotaxis signal transduction protein
MRGDEADEHVSHVLEARARALAQPPSAPADDAGELLVFTVGDTRLGVPLDRVREVLPPGPTTLLPGGPHALAGVRVVHGQLVVVANPGPVLGVEERRPPSSRFAVVLEDRWAPVGLLADAIDGVVREDPAARPAGGAGFVESVTAEGVLVLDVDALLADPRLTAVPSRSSDHPEPNEGAM